METISKKSKEMLPINQLMAKPAGGKDVGEEQVILIGKFEARIRHRHMGTDLWTGFLGKPRQHAFVYRTGTCESPARLLLSQGTGCTGVAKYLGEDGEVPRLPQDIGQRGIDPLASSAELVEIMRLPERPVMGREKSFHHLFSRLLTVKQRILDQGRGSSYIKAFRGHAL